LGEFSSNGVLYEAPFGIMPECSGHVLRNPGAMAMLLEKLVFGAFAR
jgi:hypothetical protein